MKTIRAGHREFKVRDSDFKRIQKARRGYEADLYLFARYDHEQKREVLTAWAFGGMLFEIRTLKG